MEAAFGTTLFLLLTTLIVLKHYYYENKRLREKNKELRHKNINLLMRILMHNVPTLNKMLTTIFHRK